MESGRRDFPRTAFGRRQILSIGEGNDYVPPKSCTGVDGGGLRQVPRGEDLPANYIVPPLRENTDFLAMSMDRTGARHLAYMMREDHPKRDKVVKACLESLVPSAAKLAVHPCGNFVIQKVVDYVGQHRSIFHNGEIAFTAIVRSVTRDKAFVTAALDPRGTFSLQKMIVLIRGAEELSLIMESLQGEILRLSIDNYGIYVIERVVEVLITSLNPQPGTKPRVTSQAAVEGLLQFCRELACDDQTARIVSKHSVVNCVLVECIRWTLPQPQSLAAATCVAANARGISGSKSGNQTLKGILSCNIPQVAELLVSSLTGGFPYFALETTNLGYKLVRACLAVPSLSAESRTKVVDQLLQATVAATGGAALLESSHFLDVLAFGLCLLASERQGQRIALLTIKLGAPAAQKVKAAIDAVANSESFLKYPLQEQNSPTSTPSAQPPPDVPNPDPAPHPPPTSQPSPLSPSAFFPPGIRAPALTPPPPANNNGNVMRNPPVAAAPSALPSTRATQMWVPVNAPTKAGPLKVPLAEPNAACPPPPLPPPLETAATPTAPPDAPPFRDMAFRPPPLPSQRAVAPLACLRPPSLEFPAATTPPQSAAALVANPPAFVHMGSLAAALPRATAAAPVAVLPPRATAAVPTPPAAARTAVPMTVPSPFATAARATAATPVAVLPPPAFAARATAAVPPPATAARAAVPPAAVLPPATAARATAATPQIAIPLRSDAATPAGEGGQSPRPNVYVPPHLKGTAKPEYPPEKPDKIATPLAIPPHLLPPPTSALFRNGEMAEGAGGVARAVKEANKGWHMPPSGRPVEGGGVGVMIPPPGIAVGATSPGALAAVEAARRALTGGRDKENEGAVREEDRTQTRARQRRPGMCAVCYDALATTVLLNCSHLCACSACGPSLTHCPICNSPIQSTVSVQLAPPPPLPPQAHQPPPPPPAEGNQSSRPPQTNLYPNAPASTSTPTNSHRGGGPTFSLHEYRASGMQSSAAAPAQPVQPGTSHAPPPVIPPDSYFPQPQVFAQGAPNTTASPPVGVVQPLPRPAPRPYRPIGAYRPPSVYAPPR